ncbi:hypothetical protein J2X85_002485 [Microbacterium trichothecenolyticum]|uniref:hypothetical protein n=1 Tax=Microbacterium trichothecenolyticum TaxID=69370 RepID=UPI0028666971|nr:hypothetical protein [Microbacterium trichothecenolyticum]MDR7185451.1 hypothetical protein [Microbacterium trichothecenolyticum]
MGKNRRNKRTSPATVIGAVVAIALTLVSGTAAGVPVDTPFWSITIRVGSSN